MVQSKNDRLSDLERCNKLLDDVIQTRAVAYGDDPCGRTGLFDRRFRIEKVQGKREHPLIVEEYTSDTAIFRQKRTILKYAAIEMGHWRPKSSKKDEEAARLEENLKVLRSGRTRLHKEWEERKAAEAAKTAQQQPGQSSPPEPTR